MQEESIKKYIDAANVIVISQMYLKKFPDSLVTIEDLKEYNPGHLGSSMSLNFILGNIYYYLNNKHLSHQLIIGDGHAGVSLLANLWLNGSLEYYNKIYTRNKDGLNHLIADFGKTIRSEINPEYPDTIYDGGELGYSLGVAYGYSLGSNVDIIPCIIGDGEAETGTLSSTWSLVKVLKSKTKVLPIINLNGLKMGSPSILSTMNNEEIISYFNSLGYHTDIIDSSYKNIDDVIISMQKSLNDSINYEHPLIVFKSPKGYRLPQPYVGKTIVHKNPLVNMNKYNKLHTINRFLGEFDSSIFDNEGKLLSSFLKFAVPRTGENSGKKIILPSALSNMTLDEYLSELIIQNNGIVFSPDEIYSNQFNNCSNNSFEILNENLLQAIYQGYIQSGKLGYFISYEGFMPIISSMITQYYKYLKQEKRIGKNTLRHSLNYILTSTCWENTYSHQNPDFVNSLFEKNDEFYNILYPKDKNNAIKCLEEFSKTNNQINVMTISKRHNKVYQDISKANNRIEIIEDSENPEIILCATGDYMLDYIIEIKNKLSNKFKNIKMVYVTKPQILSTKSKESLSDEEFTYYFNKDIPVIYLFNGYSMTIESILYNRGIKPLIFGYDDGISVSGRLANNIENNIPIDDIINSSDLQKILKLGRK